MKLNVYYGDIKITFEGDSSVELIRAARAHKLYKKYDTIVFESEDDEDGDQCCQR